MSLHRCCGQVPHKEMQLKVVLFIFMRNKHTKIGNVTRKKIMKINQDYSLFITFDKVAKIDSSSLSRSRIITHIPLSRLVSKEPKYHLKQASATQSQFPEITSVIFGESVVNYFRISFPGALVPRHNAAGYNRKKNNGVTRIQTHTRDSKSTSVRLWKLHLRSG